MIVSPPKPRAGSTSTGIQPGTMSGLVRALFKVLVAPLVALVMVLGVSPAFAQELRPLGPAGAKVEAPALTTPTDVPTLSPHEAIIPAVPTSWVTRDLGWLRLSYPSAATERVESLIHDADTIKGEMAESLGQDVLGHVEVRITPTVEDMTKLAPLGSPPPSYASGVAYTRLHLVLISMLAPRGGEAVDLDQVFRHELAHVALEDAVLGQHVPVWFNEGLAIGLAGENTMDRQKVLGTASITGKLLPLADLDRRFPSDHFEVNIAYAESADFMMFLRRRADHVRFASMVQRVRSGQLFEQALGDAYGSDLRKLEFQWRGEVDRRYSVIPLLAGGGIIWVGVIGALGWGYVKKRRRAKAILAKWAVEEALEDALLAQRARDAADVSDIELVRLGSIHVRAAAKVEHDGNWHTLH